MTDTDAHASAPDLRVVPNEPDPSDPYGTGDSFPAAGVSATSESPAGWQRTALAALPRKARELVDTMQVNGWRWVVRWQRDTAGHAFVTVYTPTRRNPQGGYRPDGPQAALAVNVTWHTRATQGKSLRLYSVLWTASRWWTDAGSLAAVLSWIEHNRAPLSARR